MKSGDYTTDPLPVRIEPSPAAAARACAARLAALIRESIAERGRCVLALSGGPGPRHMFRLLADEALPWAALYVVQVDERVAPRGDEARNLTAIEEAFVRDGRLPAANLHPMPVEIVTAGEPARAVAACEQTLREVAGEPPLLDVVHLGLGEDGHTASLFPGDALLGEKEATVGFVSHAPQWPRLTVTFPVLTRARRIVWFVSGSKKARAIAGLIEGHGDFPALRVARARAEVITDASVYPSRRAPRVRRTPRASSRAASRHSPRAPGSRSAS